ncbi:MAG: S9 family peptidase [Actinomycetota bacterium]
MNPAGFLDALLTLPGVAGVAGSPDCRWVAWTWYRTAPYAEVYVAPTDASAAPSRLTESSDDTRLASWLPDSSGVLVVQDDHGDERDRLFRVDLANPRVMLPLTDEAPQYFLRGGQLHPNGRWLVYGANYDFEAGAEVLPTRVYRHDLSTGDRRLLGAPELPGGNRPQLNRAGTHVLYYRSDLHPAGRQVWLVDIDGNSDREILSFGADAKVSASWFPDSRRVLLLAEFATHRRLGIWSLDDENVRWLIDDPSRNLEAAWAPPRTDRVVVIEIRDARTRASLLDVATGEELVLELPAGNLTPLAPTADGSWIGQYYSSRQPTDLVRFNVSDLDPAAFTSITRIWERTALEPQDLTPAEDYRWRSVDGLEIQGWLYRAAAPRGTVVYVHGGPTAHSEDQVNNQIQFFVSNGFNVLDPNYRGSTGFGLPFREAIKSGGGWGGLEQEDLRTGIESLIAAGIAEAGKVGVTGCSYGGYSAWCAITRWPPQVVAAAAPVCGMTDLVADYDITRPDIRPYTEEMMGGRPDQQPDRYREHSPINYVAHIRGKLLIIQGLRDPNVPMEHVDLILPKLREAGVDHDLLVFDDEGHGIRRPANQKTLYLRLAAFFEAAFADSTPVAQAFQPA